VPPPLATPTTPVPARLRTETTDPPASDPPAQQPRTVRRVPRLLCALGLATATAVGVLPASLGHADPTPTLAEVEKRVEGLTLQADQAVEAYAQARIELTAARQRSALAESRLHREQAALAALRSSMSAVVASAYRSGSSSEITSLVTASNPQVFLDKAASLDRIAQDQAARMAAITTARHRLADVQAEVTRDLAGQQVVEQRLSDQRSTIEHTLQAQRTLLAGLKAQERRRLEALRAAREAAARRAAVAAQQEAARQQAAQQEAARQQAAQQEAGRQQAARQQAARQQAGRVQAAAAARSSHRVAAPAPQQASHQSAASGSSGGGSPSGTAGNRAGTAVAEAYRKLGSPYQWAAAGPSRFDCSGLTMWVWAKAGVSLPHSAQAQYDGGRHVSREQLQPGDLVFYGSPIHHVGIYVGNGQMISAPHTGDVVKVQNALRSDFVGAVRP